ncbi:MAG: hypothetical protein HC844_12520 [Tabrizicola sp.]|nr:hypothetical protein [Tabrizicola sp.]
MFGSDPLIPAPRSGGYGEELARVAAAHRSILRHRRQRRWLLLRVALFGRRKNRSGYAAGPLEVVQACHGSGST